MLRRSAWLLLPVLLSSACGGASPPAGAQPRAATPTANPPAKPAQPVQPIAPAPASTADPACMAAIPYFNAIRSAFAQPKPDLANLRSAYVGTALQMLVKAGDAESGRSDDTALVAALAAWYVRHHALLSAGASVARLPADLDARSLEVRNRMFRCAEYHLDHDADAMRVIDHVRPGTGYLDRANDLYALANLYRLHGRVLADDRRHWRADDEKAARALYAEILHTLGLTPGADGSPPSAPVSTATSPPRPSSPTSSPSPAPPRPAPHKYQ